MGWEPRRHSWARNANLLFVDNPVGTGFSYVEEGANFSALRSAHGLGVGAHLGWRIGWRNQGRLCTTVNKITSTSTAAVCRRHRKAHVCIRLQRMHGAG